HVMVGMRGGASVLLDGAAIASGASEEMFRDDWVLATLPLEEGEHVLAVRFERPERGQWRGAIRLLGADYAPGAGNVAIAVGALSEEQAASLASSAVRIDEHHELAEPDVQGGNPDGDRGARRGSAVVRDDEA